ncbi:hypothetical protein [Actinomadura terrae]|uniref:hypothetical protein n=1 Tax=Actinomadura terrae TaxID=604353 RepID=UPI001FA6ECD0|nr:hypothetical protein [Actinomadura terrae]
MPQWHELDKNQKDAAHSIVEQLWKAGVTSATVSSVGRNLDDALAWSAGDITLRELCARARWAAPQQT